MLHRSLAADATEVENTLCEEKEELHMWRDFVLPSQYQQNPEWKSCYYCFVIYKSMQIKWKVDNRSEEQSLLWWIFLMQERKVQTNSLMIHIATFTSKVYLSFLASLKTITQIQATKMVKYHNSSWKMVR